MQDKSQGKMLVDYLDTDRERVMTGLRGAAGVKDAQEVLEREADRLLLQYNESCGSARIRDEAAGMLQALRCSIPFLDSMGEVRTWSLVENGKQGGGRGMSAASRLLLGAGAVLTVLSFLLLALSGAGTGMSGLLRCALLQAAGGGCLFFAGRQCGKESRTGAEGRSREEVEAGRIRKGLTAGTGRGKGKLSGGIAGAGGSASLEDAGSVRQRIEVLIDPEKLWHSLRGAVMVIDRNLEGAREREEAARLTEASALSGAPDGIGAAEIELFSGLLEQADADSPQMAADIRYYLHGKGIDVVPFSEQNAAWFELLPSGGISKGPVTVRPALVREGRLLKKGMAVRFWDELPSPLDDHRENNTKNYHANK